MQRDHKGVLKFAMAVAVVGATGHATLRYARSEAASAAGSPVPRATQAGFQPAAWGGLNPLAPATYLTMPGPKVFGSEPRPVTGRASS